MIHVIAANAPDHPIVVIAKSPTWISSSGVIPAFNARRAWE